VESSERIEVQFYKARTSTNWKQTTGATQEKWRARVEGLLERSKVFFTDKLVIFEAVCERNGKCDVDQRSFKAYLARWMAATTKVAPWTYDVVLPYLRSSAMAAAQSCSGGNDGVTCGHKWWVDGWDGMFGVGEQMSALEVIQSNLIERVKGPLSSETGGTSKGDASAGQASDKEEQVILTGVTKADRIGAGILTAVLSIITFAAAW
jgi:mannan endo-1,6-alpha-mannosidase